MKSFCMFRETISSPLFETIYDFETGTLECVGTDKFEFKLEDYYYKQYKTPMGYGSPVARDYYVLALQLTNGLFAVNFYDIGIISVAQGEIFIILFEGLRVESKQKFKPEQFNLFNYPMFPIGMYKTVVRQLSIVQQQCCLMVGENGEFVTNHGVVRTGVVVPRDKTEVYSMTGLVSVWRKGYDGILYDNDGIQRIYKVDRNEIKYKEVD